jgi:hypothetical protein
VSCQLFAVPIGQLKGTVCGNFGIVRCPTIPTCSGAWHAKCYRQDGADKFPVLKSKDLDDSILETEDLLDEVPDRFKIAREGDHLICPFQCDTCHFVNIHGTSPDPGRPQDRLRLLAIRRTILDSLWARETATVNATRREGARYMNEAMALGILRPYPMRGPFPLGDHWGVATACILVMRSLDKGRNAEFVQYETIRKVRSHFSNFIHTTPGGMGNMFMTSDNNIVNGIINSPTNTLWFKRFMKGCHNIMGDVWCPDRPLTMREALACQRILEDDWQVFENDPVRRLKTVVAGVTIVGGLGGGLRGQEIIRVDLGVIRKHWKEACSHPDESHIPLGMVGRFKSQVVEKIYVQPLANESVSGLGYRLWMFWAIVSYAKFGITQGPMFRVTIKLKAGGANAAAFKRAKVGDLDNIFHPVLIRAKGSFPEVIRLEVNVEEEYSVSRSLKRGATSQARNKEIPADVIEANNCWRKVERARGSTPHMALLERYADARAVTPLLVRFSREL